jgi:hypothetical protein
MEEQGEEEKEFFCHWIKSLGPPSKGYKTTGG